MKKRTVRAKIDYILKQNLIIQKFYKIIMSFVFKVIGLFVPLNDKMILFNGHGRKYNDSPRSIYEKIIKDPYFKDYEFVWALDDPDKYDIPEAKLIEMDTLRYFIVALKSKYWISSVNIERGLNFKKKETIYLNTWHGIPLKLIGNSVSGRKDYDFSDINLFCVSGKYEEEIYKRDFNVQEANILRSGLPRNDELYYASEEKIKKTKKLLGVPLDKKILLYAPTWRDSNDKGNSYVLNPPINIDFWKRKLEDEYILLLRTHAYTNELLGIEFDEFVRDFSNHSDINELLIISDVLISDYSATIFDYSILERPIISFGYDYDQYKKDRGFYLDLEKELPNSVMKTETEIIKKILNLNYEEESKKTKSFKDSYINSGGDATDICINELFKK